MPRRNIRSSKENFAGLTDLNVYQPDLLFVSNARKSILTEDCVQGAPDFVTTYNAQQTFITPAFRGLSVSAADVLKH